MGYNMRKGFTLIELVITMVIVGILSAAGVCVMLYLVQTSVFIPNKLNMDMLASGAMDTMIEGDGAAKGLRFSRVITTAQDNEIVFKDQSGQNIDYRLDTGANKLYRSIGSVSGILPYYSSSSKIIVTGKDNKLFTYYDASDAQMNNPVDPANIRRIKITLIARTGSGSFENWEGQSEQSSSIAVSKFE